MDATARCLVYVDLPQDTRLVLKEEKPFTTWDPTAPETQFLVSFRYQETKSSTDNLNVSVWLQ